MQFQDRVCPLCKNAEARVKYRSHIKDKFIFKSRKGWDRNHFQIKFCDQCHILFSSPVAKIDEGLVEGADVEVEKCAAQTYLKLLRECIPDFTGKKIIEIGSSHGFLLEELSNLGAKKLVGFDPRAPIEYEVKELATEHEFVIHKRRFTSNLVNKERFDLIIANQTLEHIENPLELLAEMKSCLRPGGALFLTSHDYTHWKNKIWGSYSPIVDFEHYQLWQQSSMKMTLAKAGFAVQKQGGYSNAYPASYWLSLIPLFSRLNGQKYFPQILSGKIRQNVGNFFTFSVSV